MSIRQMGLSFVLGMGLGASFDITINHAGTSFKRLGEQISKVENSGEFKLGKGLENLIGKTRTSNREFREAQKRLAGLKAEAEASGKVSRNLARRIDQAERKVRALSASTNRYRGCLRDQVIAAQDAGHSVKGLRREYAQLGSAIDALNRKQNRRMVLHQAGAGVPKALPCLVEGDVVTSDGRGEVALTGLQEAFPAHLGGIGGVDLLGGSADFFPFALAVEFVGVVKGAIRLSLEPAGCGGVIEHSNHVFHLGHALLSFLPFLFLRARISPPIIPAGVTQRYGACFDNPLNNKACDGQVSTVMQNANSVIEFLILVPRVRIAQGAPIFSGGLCDLSRKPLLFLFDYFTQPGVGRFCVSTAAAWWRFCAV
ncbi:hypothetical protein LF599_04665 [Pseudodesulfovibrio thermohalotolerans]|uniref:hypothetical protein n=1 Tax=Pseudodesulfovibrio thermohalotolerans TaxID=2880651 RepID=UPI0024418A62|nr:hypothetical protein [Pseudodesulfovibrio thermohalotolerans]WFS63461.1 hypothetical protein LF599_04665 [Pseudodesulfovibrio thermohalotolerans]